MDVVNANQSKIAQEFGVVSVRLVGKVIAVTYGS